MTDRAFVLLAVLGLLITIIAGEALGAEREAEAHALASVIDPNDRAAAAAEPAGDRDTFVADGAEVELERAYDHIAAGAWLAGVGFLLIGLTKLARSWLPRIGGRWRWFQTDRGGVVTVVGLAVLGQVGLLISSGRWPSPAGFIGALVAAGAASGWRTQLSRFLNPRDDPPDPPTPDTLERAKRPTSPASPPSMRGAR